MKPFLFLEYLLTLVLTFPLYKMQTYSSYYSNIMVKSKIIIDSLKFLKNHIINQFEILTSISGVDYPSKKYRFKIVYELLSIRFNTRIRIKVFSHELYPLDSSGKVFPASEWYESEVWDMFGVFFLNHSNLQKILTDYGFHGYPLRKDFPLSGYVESKYNEIKKRIVTQNLEFSQDYRFFTYKSAWLAFNLKFLYRN